MTEIHTVGIVGVGHIGASLGMVLRARQAAERVIGVDIDKTGLETARRRGAIDEIGDIDSMADVDLLLVAVLPAAVVDVALRAAGSMRPGSILTDVASTKGQIVRELEQRLPPRIRYVGGHPMGGAAARGAAAADPSLLAGRPYLLTQTARTDPDALQMMRTFIERLGMHPILLSPEEHDELVAQISHVPYLVSVALANATATDALPLHGPAFAGMVRVAGSPVDLGIQICGTNTAAIIRALATFRRELDRLERALTDDASLRPALESARIRALAIRKEQT